MMRYILLTCLMVLAVLGTKAQGFSFGSPPISTNDTTIRVTVPSSSEDVVLTLPFTNNGTDTLNLRWTRLVNDLDSNWISASVCDLIQCWTAGVNTAPASSKLPPPVTGNPPAFTIHFNNNSKAGSGHVRLAIYVPGHDSIRTVRIADFYLTVQNNASVAVKPMVDADMVKVFPNPAKDYVIVQNKEGASLDRVEVYSMLGRKVLSERLMDGETLTRIDLSEMQKGIYMVRVFDNANNVVVTKSISHIR